MHPLKSEWTTYEDAHPILVATELQNPHPVTRKLAAHFRDWLPSWNSEWGADKRTGLFKLRVTQGSIERALRLLNAFAHACDARGFMFHPPTSSSQHMELIVDGVGVVLELTERSARTPYRPTKQEQRRAERDVFFIIPKFEFRPTGELSLQVPYTRARGGRRKWSDRPGRLLEVQLNAVMLGLREIAAGCREYDQRIAEMNARIDSFHQRRSDLEQQVQEEEQAVHGLQTDAEAWLLAGTIRAYIAAVEAKGGFENGKESLSAWVRWAHAQADRIDPLTTSPPSILDTPWEDYRPYDFEELPDEVFSDADP